jgi:hypothetical protein
MLWFQLLAVMGENTFYKNVKNHNIDPLVDKRKQFFPAKVHQLNGVSHRAKWSQKMSRSAPPG